MTDIVKRLLGDPEDPPIEHWHVFLLQDLRNGKDCGAETIAAIENLERLLFNAETLNHEAAAEITRLREALDDSQATLCAVRAQLFDCDLPDNVTIDDVRDICGDTMKRNMIALNGGNL